MPYKGFDQDAHLATPKRLKREWHALILRCTRTRAQAQMAQPTLCYSIMVVDRLACPTLAMVPIAKNPERVGLFLKSASKDRKRFAGKLCAHGFTPNITQ